MFRLKFRLIGRQIKFLTVGQSVVDKRLRELAAQLAPRLTDHASLEDAIVVHGDALEAHAQRINELTETCEFLIESISRLDYLLMRVESDAEDY